MPCLVYSKELNKNTIYKLFNLHKYTIKSQNTAIFAAVCYG